MVNVSGKQANRTEARASLLLPCTSCGVRIGRKTHHTEVSARELAESETVLKLASEEVVQAVTKSNASLLMKRFLAFPEGQEFLNHIENRGIVQTKQLSDEACAG